nr:hypothetical protein [Tanacetum cinerariifolium]
MGTIAETLETKADLRYWLCTRNSFCNFYEPLSHAIVIISYTSGVRINCTNPGSGFYWKDNVEELKDSQIGGMEDGECVAENRVEKENVHKEVVSKSPMADDCNLKEQLQGREESIRNLQAQNDIMSLLNVGSTDDSCNKQALETKLTQLKDTVTSLKIQNDGYKVTNANLNRCYEELSKANTHLRTTSLEKITAQKAEIATLNAKTVGSQTSGTTKPANPKVIAPRMYAISPKYIVL